MNDKQKPIPFFVDGKEFSSTEESITGLKIKEIAGVPAGYQLFEETQGSEPDKQISDTESVNLKHGKEKHFFAVPPATFGLG